MKKNGINFDLREKEKMKADMMWRQNREGWKNNEWKIEREKKRKKTYKVRDKWKNRNKIVTFFFLSLVTKKREEKSERDEWKKKERTEREKKRK